MRMFCLLLLAAAWPSCGHAEYFRGLDAIKRHDAQAAIQELAPLADAGEADAQDALGVAYDQGGAASGETRARELFRKAAENGLLLGMLNLANSLQAGRGGPPDPAEAAQWLTRAAQAGLAPAMVRLASAYRFGLGVPLDKANAQGWYERAAKLNDPAGMAGAADVMLDSSDPATKAAGASWLQRASDAGNPHAQGMLGLAKIFGAGGIAKDEAGGAALARNAAAHGDGAGAVILAGAYHDGHGVPASEAEAVHWYAEAARLGEVRGQVETARAKLAPGPGHDAAGAYFWLEVAALRPGHMQADISSLDEAAAHEMTPSQQAQIRSKASNWRQGSGP